MNERRLLDDGASQLEREVLGSWDDEKAPEATRARALHLAAKTAGLAVVAAGTTKGLASLGAKGVGWGTSWILKGTAMALFVGASAAIVTTTLSSAGTAADVNEPSAPMTRATPASSITPAARPPSVVLTAAPPHTSASLEPPATKAHQAPRKPTTSLIPAPTITVQKPDATSSSSVAARFTEEVRMLGDAKAALAAKDPERALLALDTFAMLHPTSVLAPEAEVLRIDAHVARGDRARAKSLAEAFLAAHPSSPYRRHVQSVQLASE